MNYVFQKCKKFGVVDFASEKKHVENCSDFEKLALVNQYGLQRY